MKLYEKPYLFEEVLKTNDVMTASGENLDEPQMVSENRTTSIFNMV